MGISPFITVFGALCLSSILINAEHHQEHEHKHNHDHGHQHSSAGRFDDKPWIQAKMMSTHINDLISRLMAELSEGYDRLKDGNDMSTEVKEVNHKLEEIYQLLNRLKPQFHEHNAEENLNPEQILEELQEAHALAAPFHSNFVVHGNDVKINQEKLKNEHGKAGKTVDEAYENTAGESNIDRAIDVGKFLLDKISVTVKRHHTLPHNLDKHWKKTLTWALTSAQHAKQDVQRYVNRLEAFKNRPNSQEADGSLHGRVEHSKHGDMNYGQLMDMLKEHGHHGEHNPLSEMPFAGEKSLSSEHHHKKDRNALTEMPFAGEKSLSSEHHHKKDRNALAEMPFAGEKSLSSEHHHKRDRNALTEMPFAGEKSLSSEHHHKRDRNALTEMPFAGEKSLSSEHHHKRDRNALTEMPFAGEKSLSSEHHHKKDRNALTEMPFAGETSLSSEKVHKRNRNALAEMPFANEEKLSTETSGKVRKNRHGKRKQSSSSSSSSSSSEEHMSPQEYYKKVTSLAHLAHTFGRAVKISPVGQVVVNKHMLQGNDEDDRKVQKLLRQSMHMPDMRGDRREVKKAADKFQKQIAALLGETRSRMIEMVGPNGKHQDRNLEHDINAAVTNLGYAQGQMEKILNGLKSIKSLRRTVKKIKKHSNKMQLFRERQRHPY